MTADAEYFKRKLVTAEGRIRELESRLPTYEEAEAILWFLYHCELNKDASRSLKPVYERYSPHIKLVETKLRRLHPAIQPWRKGNTP